MNTCTRMLSTPQITAHAKPVQPAKATATPTRGPAAQGLRADVLHFQQARKSGQLSYAESVASLSRMFRTAHRTVSATDLDATVMLLTKTLRAHVHPDDHAKVLRYFAVLLRKGVVPATYRISTSLQKHVDTLSPTARMHIGEIPTRSTVIRSAKNGNDAAQ